MGYELSRKNFSSIDNEFDDIRQNTVCNYQRTSPCMLKKLTPFFCPEDMSSAGRPLGVLQT